MGKEFEAFVTESIKIEAKVVIGKMVEIHDYMNNAKSELPGHKAILVDLFYQKTGKIIALARKEHKAKIYKNIPKYHNEARDLMTKATEIVDKHSKK